MDVIPKCEYCKYNAGVDKQFGFMWYCELLGYCVHVGYKRRRTSADEFQCCKAMYLGKGLFVLDEEKKNKLDIMKTTEHFKNTIKKYLDKRAEEDTLFAVSYTKEGKNIDDCITYILNTVHKSKSNGFADDEIYSMAVHYYDEDNIKVGNAMPRVQIVTNHPIELTDTEKEQARKEAIQKYQEEAIAEIKRKSVKTKKKVETVEQPSLFD